VLASFKTERTPAPHVIGTNAATPTLVALLDTSIARTAALEVENTALRAELTALKTKYGVADSVL
jgi:hypothetical protein